jgi:tRNA A-37 threonylcarbamoyl transferase component Bud32/membrane-associated phospholipid phosphatase
VDTTPGPAYGTTQETAAPPPPTAPPGTRRSRRRRRPTGEPPPLPHHLQTSGVRWLIAAVVLVALAIATFALGMRDAAVAVTVVDDAVVRWLSGLEAPGVVAVLRGLTYIGSWPVILAVSLALPLTLLVLRRFRHLVVWIVTANLAAIVAVVVGSIAQRPRPFGVEIRGSWGGWAMPTLQFVYFTAGIVGILYTLVPEGRWRNTGKWVGVVVAALVGLARVALGLEAPTDVLVGAAIGVAIPLVGFRLFAPSEVFPVVYRRGRGAHLDVSGPRGVAIRRGLEDQLGLNVQEVKPFGLAGSAGSTPLRITVKGDPPSQLFGKLYAKSHLRADRWYKLGRELLYGRLEDEKPFNTVRRLVQQEDYALSLMHRAGLPSPTPYGFVELTPEREYLLVTEFFDGAVELGEAEVDDQVIDDGLGIIRKLWDAGLAHRDVKPANLLVRDGRLLLIDVAFVQSRPSPWRQAVDLANMMLCLGLRSSAERVYRRALRQFSVEEVTEAFAAARGLALPSQLRRMLREQGRDLHGEFVKLLPTKPQPIRIQRWSARRVGLWAAIVVALFLLVQNRTAVFNNELAVSTPLEIDTLDCADLEPLWLMAQSVPSASLVPCVRSLPAGWQVTEVTANNGRSMLVLDHDRAGERALVVRLTAACDPGGAVQGPSPTEGVRHWQRTESSIGGQFNATWYDQFPGGCVTSRLHLTSDPNGEFAAQAPQVLGFTTRASLRQALSERSDGRLRLDPEG